MISALIFWARRLWPFVTVGSLAVAVLAVWMNCHGAPASAELQVAHRASGVAEQSVATEHVRFIHDTAAAAPARILYRTRRDTVLRHLTDTVQVKATLAAADNALLLDSTALYSAGREINAHRVYERALQHELSISEKLRAPRYQLTTTGGWDFVSSRPVTGLESVVRLSERWSLVGRIEKRWEPGEPTRRMVLVRYSL